MSIPVRDRITCSVRDAMNATGIGKTKFFELIASGRVATVKVGDRRLVQVRSLLELFDPTPDLPTSGARFQANPSKTEANRKATISK